MGGSAELPCSGRHRLCHLHPSPGRLLRRWNGELLTAVADVYAGRPKEVRKINFRRRICTPRRCHRCSGLLEAVECCPLQTSCRQITNSTFVGVPVAANCTSHDHHSSALASAGQSASTTARFQSWVGLLFATEIVDCRAKTKELQIGYTYLAGRYVDVSPHG